MLIFWNSQAVCEDVKRGNIWLHEEDSRKPQKLLSHGVNSGLRPHVVIDGKEKTDLLDNKDRLLNDENYHIMLSDGNFKL